jgi:hypothetical protein
VEIEQTNEVVGKGRKEDERSDKKLRERDEVSALTHTTDTSRDVTVGVLSISIHLGNMKKQCGIATTDTQNTAQRANTLRMMQESTRRTKQKD